jgi:hypothetical protein
MINEQSAEVLHFLVWTLRPHPCLSPRLLLVPGQIRGVNFSLRSTVVGESSTSPPARVSVSDLELAPVTHSSQRCSGSHPRPFSPSHTHANRRSEESHTRASHSSRQGRSGFPNHPHAPLDGTIQTLTLQHTRATHHIFQAQSLCKAVFQGHSQRSWLNHPCCRPKYGLASLQDENYTRAALDSNQTKKVL